MISDKLKQQFMGSDPFHIFEGIVEDINDPLEAGRVRVRCFGIHTRDKSKIPTEHLPWAFVVSPSTSASISGIGSTPHGLVNGSQVIGFFRDSQNAQHPVIIGSIPGIPQKESTPDAGFNDPDGLYPLSDRLLEPDVNKLAGMSHGDSAYRTERSDLLETEIESATGTLWEEMDSSATPKYPNNHVTETSAGHILEVDSTEGSNRIHVRHSSGTYYEILDAGDVARKTEGSEQDIVAGDHNSLVKGTRRININEDAEIRVRNELTILVDGDDINIVVASGDANINIQGNVNLAVDGNVDANIQGNVSQTVDGNMSTDVGGDYSVNANGRVDIRGATVWMN